MNNTFNRRGITLIEIIISFAILGVVLIAFLSMFSSGVIWTIQARHRTETLSESQAIVEYVIGGEKNEDLESAIDRTETDLIFSFPGHSVLNFTVEGEIADVETNIKNDPDKIIILEIFRPNNSIINWSLKRFQFESL